MTARAARDRLTLVQWLSPAFPVGGFAYSHGLEAAMADGTVTDAGALETWLRGVLRRGAGQTDAVLMCHTRRADDPAPLDDLARALAASAERHRETTELGRAFAETVSSLGTPCPHLAYPVAVGWASRGLQVSDAEAASLYLQAFCGTLVSAAMRYLPLGQVEGQRVITRLLPCCLATGAAAAETELDAIGQAAFAADMAAMAHEVLNPRMFKT